VEGRILMKRSFIIVFINLFFILVLHQSVSLLIRDFISSVGVSYIEKGIIYLVHYLSAAFSSILIILTKAKNMNFQFYLWFIIAIINFALHIPFEPSFGQLIVLAALGGSAFGVGFPFSFSFFAENISVEKRGRVSGIALLIAGLFSTSFTFMLKLLKFGGFMAFLTCFTILGVALLWFLNPSRRYKKDVARPFITVLTNRYYLLYLIPWVIFCAIDALEVPILKSYLTQTYDPEFEEPLILIYTFVTSFSFILSGFLLDYYGRKKALISGFIVLGVAYAIIGIAAQLNLSWYIYFIFYGLASALFITIYTMVIWGDLSPEGLTEGYYVLGLFPFFVVTALSEFAIPYVLQIPVSAAFSFASFFLFVAVFPLMFAPETLPEKTLKERELKSYIEKAKRVREKFTKG